MPTQGWHSWIILLFVQKAHIDPYPTPTPNPGPCQRGLFFIIIFKLEGSFSKQHSWIPNKNILLAEPEELFFFFFCLDILSGAFLPSSPAILWAIGGERWYLGFQRHCRPVVLKISHYVGRGDQGETQRSWSSCFTQMKVDGVTFLCCPVFSFSVCTVISIFWAPNSCWGHETRCDFKSTIWSSCHQLSTLCLNLSFL